MTEESLQQLASQHRSSVGVYTTSPITPTVEMAYEAGFRQACKLIMAHAKSLSKQEIAPGKQGLSDQDFWYNEGAGDVTDFIEPFL